jgi:hypothetical protein
MTQTKIPDKVVHLFGEMDINMSWSKSKIYKEAFRIAEDCGYMVESYATAIKILSQNYDKVVISFENDHVVKVKRSGDEGKTWETLNFESGLFDVDQETLKLYNARITYGTPEKLPMSQGSLMNEIIKKYKIHPTQWGWHQDLIGLETHRQFLVWRDNGVGAEFLGIINKDGTPPQP